MLAKGDRGIKHSNEKNRLISPISYRRVRYQTIQNYVDLRLTKAIWYKFINHPSAMRLIEWGKIVSLMWLSAKHIYSWWRHPMETFSAFQALCRGNSPVTGGFPAQRPVTRSFDAFFDLHLNKGLSKQSWGWWFEMPSRSLWRQCNVPSWCIQGAREVIGNSGILCKVLKRCCIILHLTIVYTSGVPHGIKKRPLSASIGTHISVVDPVAEVQFWQQ